MPPLLPGLDRAAFATALGRRLRVAGVLVDLARLESFVRAIDVQAPLGRSALYWSARVTLVRHQRELAAFDQVFAVVFDDAVLALDPHARRTDPSRLSEPREEPRPPEPGPTQPRQDSALPWLTRPTLRSAVPDDQDGDDPDRAGRLVLDDPLPSAVRALADTPFDELADDQLALLSGWLEAALTRWPTRRSRRTRPHRTGRRIDLRSSLASSRRTGWDPVHLIRGRPVQTRRRIVLLCDVSRSMQPYTSVYLHLMRAAALTVQAEVFAFSTQLTRLTPVLGDRSGLRLSRQAEAGASRTPGVHRAGGTRIGYSLRSFLDSRQGHAARGAVVLIASDGWDADEPAGLEAAMSRIHRRAHHVIWLNPRVAEPGFAPLTGAMSAALPYIDDLLPGHTLRAMEAVTAAITSGPARARR